MVVVEKFSLECPVCHAKYGNDVLFKHYQTHTETAKLQAFRDNPDAFFTILLSGAALVYSELDDVGKDALYFSQIVFLVDGYKAAEKVFMQQHIDFAAYTKEITKKAGMLKARAEATQRRYGQ